jgi:ferredoxin-NADP reductase
MVYSATVLESHAQTPTTHSIRVSKPEGFSFRVSQAVRLYLDADGGPALRPMSIASSPTKDYLEFAVRRSESAFKGAFVSLKKGDEVGIMGPLGHFFLDPDRPAILLAGGIGITPLKSMIEFATDVGLPTNLTLVYSNRSPDEIVFKRELDEFALKNPNLEVIYTITRPSYGDGWSGRVGRIDGSLLRQVSVGKHDAMYYICGTPGMVSSLIGMLLAIGVQPERIMQETFRGYARRPVT